MTTPLDRQRQMGTQFRRDTDQLTCTMRLRLRESIEALKSMNLVDCTASSWEIADTIYTNSERWMESVEPRLHEYTRGDQQHFNEEMLWFLRRRLAFDVSEWLCPFRSNPAPPYSWHDVTPVAPPPQPTATPPSELEPDAPPTPKWRKVSNGVVRKRAKRGRAK